MHHCNKKFKLENFKVNVITVINVWMNTWDSQIFTKELNFFIFLPITHYFNFFMPYVVFTIQTNQRLNAICEQRERDNCSLHNHPHTQDHIQVVVCCLKSFLYKIIIISNKTLLTHKKLLFVCYDKAACRC